MQAEGLRQGQSDDDTRQHLLPGAAATPHVKGSASFQHHNLSVAERSTSKITRFASSLANKNPESIGFDWWVKSSIFC